MKPRSRIPDDPGTDDESPEESPEESGSPHPMEHGRKAEARYYGDDPDATGDDANLSALFAEMGAEDRLDEVGL